jgi:hypothetical protein
MGKFPNGMGTIACGRVESNEPFLIDGAYNVQHATDIASMAHTTSNHYFGNNTLSTTITTPFLCITSYVEISAVFPDASATTMLCGPFSMNVRLSPLTVLSSVFPHRP